MPAVDGQIVTSADRRIVVLFSRLCFTIEKQHRELHQFRPILLSFSTSGRLDTDVRACMPIDVHALQQVFGPTSCEHTDPDRYSSIHLVNISFKLVLFRTQFIKST